MLVPITMSREQMQGKQERGKLDVPEKVVVAVKASKEIPKSALVWALTHVVQPGDSITLLAVVLSQSSGRRFWGFGRWGCASGNYNSGATLDQRSDITDSCSQMIRQLRDVYDPNKVSIKIRIVSGSPCGAVAMETKKAQANWVVLDKHLKHEEKRCMDELQCNIVVMKRSKPKVLRLNLVGRSKETEVAAPVGQDKSPVECTINNNNSSESIQGQVVTPTSSPELGTPFTATTEAGTSSASSDPGGSPFFISETTRNLKKEDLFIVKESTDVNEYSSDSESEAPSAAPSRRFEPCVEGFLNLHCKSSRRIEEESEIGKIEEESETSKIERGSDTSKSVEQPPMTKVLQERFSKFDRQNCRSDLELNGTVREAVSLSRNVPPGPPPLCSICQHKAPVFGNPPRWFSYADLELATGGFSQVNFLAEGGFGSVHRGVLPDGRVIAVKQHKLASSQGDLEFCSEVEVLSRAQHRNVVMLIGFCIEDKRRLLVYEYICNGSLDSHLYGHHQEPLEWPARQKVAVGAARGLRYLHEECRVGCIIHRDMRPNNILVTHDFEPLVGDFGLARWQPDGQAGVETRVIGTFGYLAPEYAESGQITEKADVYSFGVVLVELVTGRKAVDLNRPKGQQCLTEWARPLLEEHAINELIDPRLGNRYSEQEVHCMLHAASLCIRRDPQTRPRMSQVLRILEGDMIMDSNFMPTPGSDVGNRSGRIQAEPLLQEQQHYANPLWNEEASEEAFSNNVPPSSPAFVEEDTITESPCQVLLINQEA